MEKRTPMQELRVLVADHNQITGKQLEKQLVDGHFTTKVVHTGAGMADLILEFRPHFILMDLTMRGFSALDCLAFLKEHNLDEECKVIVLSTHNAEQNVSTCLKMGARDYLVKPISAEDVLARLVLHLRARKQLSEVEEIKNESIRLANHYLNLGRLLIKTTGVNETPHKIQYKVTHMLSMALSAVRISLIDVQGDAPMIVTSSDDEDFKNFKMDIKKYPEVEYVIRTSKPLFIESLEDDEQMAFIKGHLRNVEFNSIVALPLIYDRKLMGVLSAKFTESSHISDADIRLCQLGAELLSVFWVLRTKKYLAA